MTLESDVFHTIFLSFFSHAFTFLNLNLSISTDTISTKLYDFDFDIDNLRLWIVMCTFYDVYIA